MDLKQMPVLSSKAPLKCYMSSLIAGKGRSYSHHSPGLKVLYQGPPARTCALLLCPVYRPAIFTSHAHTRGRGEAKKATLQIFDFNLSQTSLIQLPDGPHPLSDIRVT